jgi:hypothetical protein
MERTSATKQLKTRFLQISFQKTKTRFFPTSFQIQCFSNHPRPSGSWVFLSLSNFRGFRYTLTPLFVCPSISSISFFCIFLYIMCFTRSKSRAYQPLQFRSIFRAQPLLTYKTLSSFRGLTFVRNPRLISSSKNTKT